MAGLALRAILTQLAARPLPSPIPHYSFCLLLMRLLTLINVFSYYAAFYLCLLLLLGVTQGSGERSESGFGFRFPFEIPFTARMSKRKGRAGTGITRITRIVSGAARLLNSLKISIATAATPAITITITKATAAAATGITTATFKCLPTGKLFAGCHMSIKLTLEWQSKRTGRQRESQKERQRER